MLQLFDFGTAGRQIDAAATYLRYEAETSGVLNDSVRIRVDGQDLGLWRPGDYAQLQQEVRTIEVIPQAGATGQIRVGKGFFASSRISMSGNIGASVIVAKAPIASFANAQATVTNASGLLLPERLDRQYLLIQNKDGSGAIFVTFGAAAATQAAGLKIGPGGFFEWNSTVPSNEVRVIGDAANNPNILTVEGW